jgi:hypothetical protein
MEPSARIWVDSWRDTGHIGVASETPSCESPLTEVAWFEYHNALKAKLVMVAITEATAR